MAESDTSFYYRNCFLLHWRATLEMHGVQFPRQDLSRHRAPGIRISGETVHIKFHVSRAIPSRSRVLDTARGSLREVVRLDNSTSGD